MMYMISIVTENKPGVLNRLTGVLSKRKINIESLSAYAKQKETVSHITTVADIDPRSVDTIIKQIYKIIEVVSIRYQIIHP